MNTNTPPTEAPSHPHAQAAGCPILDDTRSLQNLSQDMTRLMRKLRRDLKKCGSCPSYPDCPVLASFNQAVQTALDEVYAEWKL